MNCKSAPAVIGVSRETRFFRDKQRAHITAVAIIMSTTVPRDNLNSRLESLCETAFLPGWYLRGVPMGNLYNDSETMSSIIFARLSSCSRIENREYIARSIDISYLRYRSEYANLEIQNGVGRDEEE